MYKYNVKKDILLTTGDETQFCYEIVKLYTTGRQANAQNDNSTHVILRTKSEGSHGF
jgi:hypothetical protein